MQEMKVWSLSQEVPLEEGMATHSGILPWRIPWTEKPGVFWSIGSQSRTRLKWLSMQPTRTYCIAQGTLPKVMWQPGWERSWGESGYMYMYGWIESLCCPPETITTLLISYTPIENEKSKKETNPPNILPLYVLLSVSLQGVLSCGQGRLQKSPPVILSGQRQTKTVHLGLVFSCSFP